MTPNSKPNWNNPRKICIGDELTDAELHLIELAKLKANGVHSPQQQLCNCVECKIGGKRFPLHRVPIDCQYTALRSALVSAASRIADERVTVHYGNGDNGAASDRWTKTFVKEMDRLAAQLGL
jgi:hypothetical protein